MKQRDPAFLFYSSDFLVGTMMMSDEEVGVYIRLLAYSHTKDGKLTQKEVDRLHGMDYPEVMSKFECNNEGLYYNKRLYEEMEQRKNVAERNRINGSKGGNPNLVKGKHNPYYKPKDILKDNQGVNRKDNRKINITLENENEDVIEDINDIKDVNALRPKTLKEVITYFDNKDLNNTFIDFITMRKSLKNGAMTERAISMMINKINKHDEQTAIEMLNQSILNNWKDIFEVKEDFQRQQKTKKQILDDDKNKQMLEVMRERGIV